MLVQNLASRWIFKVKEKRICLFLQLHWLPIRQIIFLKVSLMIYKCLHGLAPVRSDPFNTPTLSKAIVVPNNTSTLSDKSFIICGNKLWDTLAVDFRDIYSIRSFKKHLKRFLFSNAHTSEMKLNVK